MADHPAPAPPPTPTQPEMAQPQVREVRAYVFGLNAARPRVRNIPIRRQPEGQTRQEPRMRGIWTCWTAFAGEETVHVKRSRDGPWDYYDIHFSIPLIPGFGRGNIALRRIAGCPAFIGEIIIVRRIGRRLDELANMRYQDRKKAEVAVTQFLRHLMHLRSGRDDAGITIQYLTAEEQA